MKVLTVCGLGMGSSLILRMNVEKILAKNGVDAEVDHVDVSMANQTKADLIVTSNELVSMISPEKKVVCVKNFVDMEEIETKLIEVIKK